MFNVSENPEQGAAAEAQRPRARDLGVVFDGEPGPLNAITDVPGLEVGFTTLIADEPATARTGVTAILPRGRESAGVPCAAGIAVLNGNGEPHRAQLDRGGGAAPDPDLHHELARGRRRARRSRSLDGGPPP